MKKFFLLFILIAVVLLATVFSVSCKDKNKPFIEEFGSDGLTFSLYEDGYSVKLVGSSLGDIVIPSTYNYKPIRSVAIICDDFNSINMPDSVRNAYLDFTRGYKPKWYEKQPDGVLYLGSVAFGYKGEMPDNASINIKNGTTAISTRAFALFPSLTNITIPKSVKYVGEDAFHGTAWYEKQPDGLVYVGNVLYKYKGQMPENTSIKLKKNLSSIGCGAFSGCTGLTDISIPDSVTSIGDWAFDGCTGLTSITIPKSVESVGYSAFYCCINLKSITVKNKDLRISNSAFGSCPSIRDLSAPDGFLDASIIVRKGTQWFDYQPDGILYVGKVACGYKGETPRNGEIVLKDGTIGVGSEAFYDCNWMTSISIPESVTTVGKYAFYGCENLKSISISNSVTSMEISAFEKCISLTSVEIPNSVKVICDRAFFHCTSLTSVTLPTDLIRISDSVFYGCCALKSVNIPNGVRSVGDGAFKNCTELTSITIPDSVTTIGSYVFEGCTGLTSVTIPDSVTTIGSYVFEGCTGLTSVTIPDSVTTIGNNFERCTGLTSIKYKGTMENWNEKFSWLSLPASCVVICTDGTISK